MGLPTKRNRPPLKRGFARLSDEHKTMISTLGGLLQHDRPKFDSETGSAAGKIGGRAKHPNKGFGTTRRKKPLEQASND